MIHEEGLDEGKAKKIQTKKRPEKVAITGSVLKYKGKKISCEKGIICQLIIEPEKMAPIDKRKVGKMMLLSLLEIKWVGVHIFEFQMPKISRRNEYAEVNAVARNNKKTKPRFELEKSAVSIIKSFE